MRWEYIFRHFSCEFSLLQLFDLKAITVLIMPIKSPLLEIQNLYIRIIHEIDRQNTNLVQPLVITCVTIYAVPKRLIISPDLTNFLNTENITEYTGSIEQ